MRITIRPFARALLAVSALTTAVGVMGTSQAADPTFRVGFGVRAITPVGAVPAEWSQYFTPEPTTGVWGEPFTDVNGDGCYNPANADAESGEPFVAEPFVDQPWNSTGDGYMTGAYSVRGVTIIGDNSSTGKWDGLWANAGFGSKCAKGMHDDTWARAIVMELGDDNVAMVSLDVVGLFNIEVRRAREEMKARYPEMPIDELIVSSTHTHEGVDTMGYWGQLFLNTDGKSPTYQAFIRSQIIDAVHDAWTGREAAKAKLATGEQPMAIRDSRPPFIKDPRVPSAQFVRGDGSIIGTVVSWNNHPEAQGSNNPLISSDFPHGTRSEIEIATDAPAIYFSGMVGGLQTPLREFVPDPVTGEAMPDQTWERTYQLGAYVADSALDALATVDEPVEITTLKATRREFYMDMDNNVLRALNVRGVFDIPTYIGGESWGPSSGHTAGVATSVLGPQVQTEMVLVDIGQAMFLTVPGELSPEIIIGGYGRPDCPAADTGRPFEPVVSDFYEQPVQFILGLGQDELGYIIPGYDFHILSAGESSDGRGVVPLGGLEVEGENTCGEGHYEETVSGSSVFAPWVACVGKELAGENPWDMSDPLNAACSYENTHTNPYGITPAG